jgi:hypothetical protein
VIAVAGGIELDAQTMRLLLVAPSDAVTYVPV